MNMLKRLPPLGAIQAFVAVAHESNFGRAAEELHLSQSSISRQVSQLEDHFGCLLFERHTRRVVLTEAGRRLLPIAEQLMELLVQAHRAVVNRQDVVTLRVHPSIAVRWLLPRLPEFYSAHPGLRVNIDTAWTRIPDFVLEGIDAMIEYGTGPWPRLQKLPLWRERLTPVCQPAYWASVDQRASLRGAVLLHTDAEQKEWGQWAAQFGCSIDGARHLKFDTLDLALNAAQYGHGVALADVALIEAAVSSGQLVQPYAGMLETGCSYNLLFPQQSAELETFGLFRDWLSDAATATRKRIDALLSG